MFSLGVVSMPAPPSYSRETPKREFREGGLGQHRDSSHLKGPCHPPSVPYSSPQVEHRTSGTDPGAPWVRTERGTREPVGIGRSKVSGRESSGWPQVKEG